MHYFTHDLDGNILAIGECQPELLPASTGSVIVREGEANAWTQFYDTTNGVLRDFTPEQAERRRAFPGVGYRWSLGNWIDERPLTQAKITRWTMIKRAREAAENGTFRVGAYSLQCDEESRARLTATAQAMADADGPDTVQWMLADNSTITVNRPQMRAAVRALRDHMQAQHDRAQARRASIEAATTLAQVDAVVW